MNAEYRRTHRAELAAMTPYQRSQSVPWPSYAITNLSGNIARNRSRLADLRKGPRPTWFKPDRRHPDLCYVCDCLKDDHTPHPNAPEVLMCPDKIGAR